MSMSTRVLEVRVDEADRDIATDLACMPGDPVVFIERLRVGDGEPLVLDTAHLPAALVPGLEAVDFERRSLYEVLEQDYGHRVSGARETLEPVILTPRECELLEVPRHSTALLTRRVTTAADGTVLALGHVLLRGDRSRYIYTRAVDSDGEGPDGSMHRLRTRSEER